MKLTAFVDAGVGGSLHENGNDSGIQTALGRWAEWPATVLVPGEYCYMYCPSEFLIFIHIGGAQIVGQSVPAGGISTGGVQPQPLAQTAQPIHPYQIVYLS